jgi:hypothetical protein
MTTATSVTPPSTPSAQESAAQSISADALWPRIFLLVVMLAAIVLGLAPLSVSPPVVPATAPAADFSAERALRDLAVVAATPHPIGSPANAAVRDYLIGQIRALGLEPEVQEATIARADPSGARAQVVKTENILVRLPGTASTGAVLVSGHYDSVPTSPGAADCAGCAATTLETLRALQAGPPLKNDVIFLFTDGEEIGVRGAAAFVEQHPWAEDVAVALIFEGYGTGGAAMIYVTSPESGEILGQAVAAMPHPLASSFLNDLMWTLARNTGSDLDAFVAGGHAGLSFIHLSLAGATAYHTAADSLANLDPRSLQHHGEHAVAVVRHFGDLPLDTLAQAPNAVDFAVAPYVMVRYGGQWALPLAILAALAWVGVVVVGLRRHALHVGGLLLGIVLFLVSLLASVVVVTLAWWLLRLAEPRLHMYTVGGWYAGPLYLLAFLALTLAVVAALYNLARRRFALADLAVGTLAWWVLLAPLTALNLAGFSYLFAWPLLAASLVLGWFFLWPQPARRAWPRALALAAGAAVTLVLTVPAIYFLAVYWGRIEAMAGVPFAALPVPFAVLTMGALLPQLDFLAPVRRWPVPVGALATCVVLLGLAFFVPGYSLARPKLNTVAYLLNADTGQARWVTVNDSRNGRGTRAQLDEWTSQFFPNGATETQLDPWRGFMPPEQFPALEGPAPAVELPHSTVTVAAESVTPAGRLLRLDIAPPPDVHDSILWLAAAGPLQLRGLAGTEMQTPAAADGKLRVDLAGRPAGPIVLDVLAPAGEPVRLRVEDRLLGLPALPGVEMRPRSAWMAPAPFNYFSDSTIVERTWTFAPSSAGE